MLFEEETTVKREARDGVDSLRLRRGGCHCRKKEDPLSERELGCRDGGAILRLFRC
jgi:hypothetical protein